MISIHNLRGESVHESDSDGIAHGRESVSHVSLSRWEPEPGQLGRKVHYEGLSDRSDALKKKKRD